MLIRLLSPAFAPSSKLIVASVGVCVIHTLAHAGPYSRPSNDALNPIDAPVARTDPRIQSFETSVASYAPAPGVSPTFSNPNTGLASLGELTAAQISAGAAPGSITLRFNQGIRDGAGPDLAVFENGFEPTTPDGSLFMELAHVEVSSNGTHFERFDSISTNTAPVPGSFPPPFAFWDSTNVYNLAGKHAENWGTPFDLAQLASRPAVTGGLLDLNNIQFVRLVDIPGNGSFKDSLGNPIRDNWQGALTTGGFDYVGIPTGAVGVLHPVPTVWSLCVLAAGGAVSPRRRRFS